VTDDRYKSVSDGLAKLQEVLADAQKKRTEREATEHTRRAALTGEQRAAEDRATAELLARAEREKIRAKLMKLGAGLLKRETWTIDKFGWLLAVESPDDPTGWTVFDARPREAIKLHKELTEVLESGVPLRLKPVNPTAPAREQRFEVVALLKFAGEKRLGCFEVLSELLGHRAVGAAAKPRPAEAKALAAAGRESREGNVARRRRALVEFARQLAQSGQGYVMADSIELAVNGIELNSGFRARFPQWKDVSDKTLESDRASSKPRIHVAMGRPSKDP